jgi:hypothetical protein
VVKSEAHSWAVHFHRGYKGDASFVRRWSDHIGPALQVGKNHTVIRTNVVPTK